MKYVVLFKKDVVLFKIKLQGKILCGGLWRVRVWILSSEANSGPLKGEKDDVYRAVRTITAMESLKVMPVRYEKFLVANKHRYM